MFKKIQNIQDIHPFVAAKKEIRFSTLSNGTTLGCYIFSDSKTFDSLEAMECRGITFDDQGAVCSRPLHKFFNVGEKDGLMPAQMLERDDVVAVYEKLDGSMIATAWVKGELKWRSKKSFSSDVVKLTEELLCDEPNKRITQFAYEVAKSGLTAIFELTHPMARIVVAHDKPQLRLLHVRDNVSGQYVLLDPTHRIHGLIARYEIIRAPVLNLTVAQVMAALEEMTEQEGYVLQFANGDMAKWKCPWYARLHRSITFLRERDIAASALNDELDDLKGVLAEAGIDLTEVNKVESRLKTNLLGIYEEINAVVSAGHGMDAKSFAIAHKEHPLFGLLMAQFKGRDPDVKEWYGKNRLRQDFSLRVLADGALADALEG